MGFSLKKFYDKGKSYVRRGADKGKDYGRGASKGLAKASPYIAGVSTFTLSFVPVVGWAAAAVVGTGASASAGYFGAAGARGDGKKGKDAREVGRDARKKTAIGAGLGLFTGIGASLLSAAPSAGGAAAPAAAKGGSGIWGFAQGVGATAGKAGAAAAGSGWLGTAATTVVGLLPGVAGFLKPQPKPGEQQEEGGFLENLLGAALGAGGGMGGTGDVSAPGDVADAQRTGAGIPTLFKVAGGLAAAIGGYLVYRSVKKAA